MKKNVLVLLLLLFAASTLFAGDFEFVLDDFKVNKDVLFGFAPTFLTAGVDYTGFDFIDGQNTDLFLIAGGGYTQRELWRDERGDVVREFDSTEDMRRFNVLSAQWKLLLEQGLFWSNATYSDLITLFAGYQGRYEQYLENDHGKDTGSFFFNDGPAYVEGDRLLGNELTGGLRLSTVQNDKVVKRGFGVNLAAVYAPGWMLNEQFFDSSIDYYSVTGKAEGYLPVYEKRATTGLNAVTVFLADRVRVDAIDGNAVPVYAQKKTSLGHKMRGFEAYSYATSFSVVNNFDVRVSGPEVVTIGLFPRGGVYLDIGYTNDDYLNVSDPQETNWLASTGIELAFSVFDFLNLGVRGNYAFIGDTLTGSDFSYDIFLTMHY